jgi:hypothetical protein
MKLVVVVEVVEARSHVNDVKLGVADSLLGE